MRYLLLNISFLLTSVFSYSNADMPRIPASIFVNGGQTDFSILFKSIDKELKNKVQLLFDEDRLDHSLSKAYDVEAVFDRYWKENEKLWHSLDVNKDGVNELIYLSILSETNESESFEIYSLKDEKYRLIFGDSGHLLAYKIHPNTKEIILFHHKYPCCSSASHNINMIRLVGGQIVLRKKYFIAKNEGMKGIFFPKKVNYTSDYFYLNTNTTLRWSSGVIDEKASDVFNDNIIAIYPKGTPYRILAEENGWKYVLFCGVPSKKESNIGIITPENFSEIHVFGWIEK